MPTEQHYGKNWRSPKVDIHSFAISPKAEIPRSTIRMQHTHKTTIMASFLTPIYLQEVLPGDTFTVKMSAFCRLATPIYPIMDQFDLETFFFFVPNRLVWIHWYKFMGEQDLPTDSISYTIPTITSPAGGFSGSSNNISLYGYFGLPTVGQTAAGNTITISALPLRAYTLIFNQWFRDENVENSQVVGSQVLTQVGSTAGYGYVSMDDGPDLWSNYTLFLANRRRDYFAACLPWPQKGTQGAIPIITGNATVTTQSTPLLSGAQAPVTMLLAAAGGAPGTFQLGAQSGQLDVNATAFAGATGGVYFNNLYANLGTAAGNTINALRTAVQTQKLLERDARGGTRYTEIIRNHFGVVSPDARLMRPEYLGGGKQPINIAPVPQTTATGLTGGTSPLGTLAAVGTLAAKHGFRQSFTEHGYILGLVTARRDNVYQQGIPRLWSRSTRYDFYLPVLAELGEQAVLNKEIFSDGGANDPLTFGYQERWGEYRWHRSYATGFFQSNNSTPLDAWHLASKYTVAPTLNSTFVSDDTYNVLRRVLAGGNNDDYQQILCDFFFDEVAARPMPMYSVPGHMDHF